MQLTRKALSAFQKGHDWAAVDIADHKYDQAKGTAESHQYRVHVARLAAIATVEARQSREWAINPGRALATAARAVSLPNGPLHRRRGGRRDDVDARIKRNLNTARTLLANAAESFQNSGGRAEISLEQLAEVEEQLQALRALAEGGAAAGSKVTDINARRRDRAPVADELAARDRAAQQRAEAAENESDDGGAGVKNSHLQRPNRFNNLRKLRHVGGRALHGHEGHAPRLGPARL